MKKLLLTIGLFAAFTTISKAQLLPKVQFGAKAGVNLSSLSNTGSTFGADNRAGYLAGFWARFGALGFNFQPELYITSKNVDINNSNGVSSSAKFTSIDVPLLLGGKIGAFGLGGRFYAGPLLSFAINRDGNTFGNAVGNAASLRYKDANFALTAGAGVDIRRFSVDLRYEAGLSKQEYIDGSTNIKTRVSLFNLSLGYAFL